MRPRSNCQGYLELLISTIMSDGKAAESVLYDFRPPSLNLDLAIGHKHNAWYLILAKDYRTADTREVVRLDAPGLPIRKTTAGLPHFCFNLEAESGWERKDENLLDFLLNLGPKSRAVLRVVPQPTDGDDSRSNCKEVEVLISEAQLAHWCENCGRWEIKDNQRWIVTRQGSLPGYLCPDVSSHLMFTSFPP